MQSLLNKTRTDCPLDIRRGVCPCGLKAVPSPPHCGVLNSFLSRCTRKYKAVTAFSFFGFSKTPSHHEALLHDFAHLRLGLGGGVACP